MPDSASTSKRDALSSILVFFREHPAILISLVYLQITTTGVIYSWSLYSKLGINIFDFAETNDFLLAAFKEPFAYVMSLITIAAFFAQSVWVLGRLRKRNSERLHRSSKLILIIAIPVIIAYTIVPAYYYGLNTASDIHTGFASHVDVRYSSSPAGIEDRELTFIGTTEKFAFFYDASSKAPLVISIRRIVSINFSTHRNSGQ